MRRGDGGAAAGTMTRSVNASFMAGTVLLFSSGNLQ